MHDPGEPLAMWDSEASHVLLPLTNLPKNALGTSTELVRLAVGNRHALYWNDVVFCKDVEPHSSQPTR
eukprot:4299595-Prorocentrum_lima.AAC.1